MIQKKTIGIGVLSVVFLVLTIIGYAYVFAMVKEKNESVASISNEMYFIEESMRTQEAVRKMVRTIHDDQARLEDAFVSPDTVPEFLGVLEARGSRVGVTVETQTVSVDTKREILLVGLTARGDFDSVFRYLESLESTPYHMRVVKTNLIKSVVSDEERASLVGKPWPWEGVFSIEVYSFENI